MNKEARMRLQQVLRQNLEQELSKIPGEQEIRRQHSFSELFLKNMEELVNEKDEVIDMEKKRKEKNAGRRFWRAIAACLVVAAAVFGIGALSFSSIRYGSSAPSESTKSSDSSYSAGAEAYDVGEYVQSTEEMATEEYASDEGAESGAAGASELPGAAAVNSQQKLIYTVYMDMETTEYDTLLSSVKEKVERLGGYIENSETSGDADKINRSASLTIRIPAEKRNELTETVKTEANVTYFSERAEDVTLTYVDTQARIESLRTEQETLMGLLGKAEDIDTVLAIQNQLTQVRYELQSYESQLKVMENQISYSTFYITVSEVQRVTVPEESSFGAKLQERFAGSLDALGEGFQGFFLFLLGDFPILLTVAVIVAVVALAVRYIIRRRRKKSSGQSLEDDN